MRIRLQGCTCQLWAILERSAGVLGMSSAHYRSGGAHEVLTFAVGQCSLGTILVASSANGEQVMRPMSDS